MYITIYIEFKCSNSPATSYGAPEFVDLELYLMWRGRGMKIETPAVRP